MKKLIRFLVIIPALVLSLFFFSFNSKGAKALSLDYSQESLASSYYDNALIQPTFLDIFDSIDITFNSTIPANYDLYEGNVYASNTWYDVHFNDFVLNRNDLYSPRIVTITCYLEKLTSPRTIGVWGRLPAMQSLPINTSVLQCKGVSVTPTLFNNTTNYLYYSNPVTTAYNSNFNYSFVGDYRNSLVSYFNTNSYRAVGFLSAGVSLSSNFVDYLVDDYGDIQHDLSLLKFLQYNLTGVANGSRQTTKTSYVESFYNCNYNSSSASSSYGFIVSFNMFGASSSHTFTSNQQITANSSHHCVTSTAETFGYVYHLEFADMLSAYGRDRYNQLLYNLTQNTFYGGYVAESSPSLNISFSHLGNTNHYNQFFSTIPFRIQVSFNFNYPFTWLFNGIISRLRLQTLEDNYSTFNFKSINWQEYSAGYNLDIDTSYSTNSSIQNVYLMEDYRSPNSSYLLFNYFITQERTFASAKYLHLYLYQNFNFLYMNEMDIINVSSYYGVKYRDCNWYDVLCWLQNGFTYIIYEMPVVSPIINFVKSGVSTISSFNGFIGNFSVFDSLFVFISVPLTWLVIKKLFGGDN